MLIKSYLQFKIHFQHRYNDLIALFIVSLILLLFLVSERITKLYDSVLKLQLGNKARDNEETVP